MESIKMYEMPRHIVIMIVSCNPMDRSSQSIAFWCMERFFVVVLTGVVRDQTWLNAVYSYCSSGSMSYRRMVGVDSSLLPNMCSSRECPSLLVELLQSGWFALQFSIQDSIWSTLLFEITSELICGAGPNDAHLLGCPLIVSFDDFWIDV